MTTGLIGRKLGMTRVFSEDGVAVPVTVIEAGPCRVVQVREGGVQLGFGARRKQRTTRAELGHAKKAGLDAAPQVLRVFPVNGDAPTPGAEVKVDIFAPGERVKVTGKGKIVREQAGKRHLLEGKSSHVTRRMTGTVVIDKADTKRVKKLLGR